MNISKKLGFLFIYLLVPLPIIGFFIGGWGNFFTFLFVFSVIPLVDAFMHDSVNASPDQEKALLRQKYFKAIVYGFVPCELFVIYLCLYLSSHSQLSPLEIFGFAASVGLISGGAGINFAHEMMHKNSKVDHFLSKLLLVHVCYGHFFIEHVKGHHVKVATPEDPATARFGESLYQFLPRTVIESFKSAFKLEQKRLSARGYAPLGIHNQFWWIIPAPLAIAAISYWIGGGIALAFFVIQAIFGFLMLEIVNYIEHYGLERKKLPNGQYERVSPYHSWNANHWLSNLILFHLQRHSDHHTYGARPYQVLRHMEQSPQLPSGYLGMMLLAIIPPLWHKVMDKRVLAYRTQLEYLRMMEASRLEKNTDSAITA